MQPLYCYAISSKRYALFNIDAEGKIILRKVSAHGLGHLIAPYQRKDKTDLEDAQPWQQDLWLEIINAARKDTQPDFNNLQNFNMPAVSRYGATTPALEKWFEGYNKDKPYSDRVRPFNFLLAMQAKPGLKSLKPVAPYNKNPAKALAQGFDRSTGQGIKKHQLKTNLDGLAQYHLHPETKFLNGDFLDKGRTQRRHVIVKSIQHIGKEANKWEEQFFTGHNPDAQIEYGICPEQKIEMLGAVLHAITTHGAKRVADIAKLSERHVFEVSKGNKSPSERTLAKLHSAAKFLKSANVSEQGLRQRIKTLMEKNQVSIRSLAVELETDSSNLAKVLSGGRNAGDWLIRAEKYLINIGK